MTALEILHKNIGPFKLGSIRGIIGSPDVSYQCILKPTDKFVEVQILTVEVAHTTTQEYKVLYAEISGLGNITFIDCRLSKFSGSSAKGGSYIVLKPSLMLFGEDNIPSDAKYKLALIHFDYNHYDSLPRAYEASVRSGVINRLSNPTVHLYMSSALDVTLERSTVMSTQAGLNKSRSASITEGTCLRFDFKEGQAFKHARELVVISSQLLAAFFTRRISVYKESYDFKGRYMGRMATPLHDSTFHINTRSPFNFYKGFHNPEALLLFQPAFAKLTEWMQEFPNLMDLFWHASVHAQTTSRLAIDSFLYAGRLAEEILHLMHREFTDVKIPKGSSVSNILLEIHQKRPFVFKGVWQTPEEFFSFYQDTKNLYAHGSTQKRNRVLYGFDINFMALSIHSHLFVILGELLGMSRNHLLKSHRHLMNRHHDLYLSHKKAGSPISSLTRSCEWRFS